MYSDFELQGIEEEKLNNKAYQTVMQRIQMEEAAASVSNGLYRENEDFEYVVVVTNYSIFSELNLINTLASYLVNTAVVEAIR